MKTILFIIIILLYNQIYEIYCQIEDSEKYESSVKLLIGGKYLKQNNIQGNYSELGKGLGLNFLVILDLTERFDYTFGYSNIKKEFKPNKVNTIADNNVILYLNLKFKFPYYNLIPYIGIGVSQNKLIRTIKDAYLEKDYKYSYVTEDLSFGFAYKLTKLFSFEGGIKLGCLIEKFEIDRVHYDFGISFNLSNIKKL